MFEFYWKVPESGCEWVIAKMDFDFASGIIPSDIFRPFLAEGRRLGSEEINPIPKDFDRPRDYLTPKDSHSREPLNCRTYAPLREPALFRTFADIDESKRGILEFANRYGMLGLSGHAGPAILKPIADEQNAYHSVRGERLQAWLCEISVLRHAIRLWEATRRGDAQYLSQFIRWHGPNAGWQRDGVSYIGPQFPSETCTTWLPRGWSEMSCGGDIFLGSPSTMSEIGSLFTPGDPILPARAAVQRAVNERLEMLEARPKLLWEHTRDGLSEKIRIVPSSLISALWIQLAQAIEGDRKYRQCVECKKWYEVSGDRRADARFCSDPCRFRAYRKRQKEAKRLHATGVSPKDIAKQLGSDTKTVKGWIDQK